MKELNEKLINQEKELENIKKKLEEETLNFKKYREINYEEKNGSNDFSMENGKNVVTRNKIKNEMNILDILDKNKKTKKIISKSNNNNDNDNNDDNNMKDEKYNKLYYSYVEIVIKKEELENEFNEQMKYFNDKVDIYDKKVQYFNKKITHYKNVCNMYIKNNGKISTCIKKLEEILYSIEKVHIKDKIILDGKIYNIKIIIKEINECIHMKIQETEDTDVLLYDEVINEKNILLEKILNNEKDKNIYHIEKDSELEKYMKELNFKNINDLFTFHLSMLDELCIIKKCYQQAVEENAMKIKEYDNNILILNKQIELKEKKNYINEKNCKSLLLEVDNLKFILNDLLSYVDHKDGKRNKRQRKMSIKNELKYINMEIKNIENEEQNMLINSEIENDGNHNEVPCAVINVHENIRNNHNRKMDNNSNIHENIETKKTLELHDSIEKMNTFENSFERNNTLNEENNLRNVQSTKETTKETTKERVKLINGHVNIGIIIRHHIVVIYIQRTK
ncbi:hypothetical protein PFTANZ_01774 [Plasmodium falciparum Tanzania (2000708)]|uniref:Uncharacterized protein n=1 Tax=Plasmodium falciparum Tanzania (2000708) TaxID=1036725 RepID=A0A024WAH7_PLAFA|nr:hypothetical protein PFTANZ_01774 [Plasmodium falciparum Tanzania (2000708)]